MSNMQRLKSTLLNKSNGKWYQKGSCRLGLPSMWAQFLLHQQRHNPDMLSLRNLILQ